MPTYKLEVRGPPPIDQLHFRRERTLADDGEAIKWANEFFASVDNPNVDLTVPNTLVCHCYVLYEGERLVCQRNKEKKL